MGRPKADFCSTAEATPRPKPVQVDETLDPYQAIAEALKLIKVEDAKVLFYNLKAMQGIISIDLSYRDQVGIIHKLPPTGTINGYSISNISNIIYKNVMKIRDSDRQ
ncbi:hypothetical protein ACFBZI_04625 [Moraxella sp. ZJ142]|uniref:hypothetical protein n=1 Tax=Moraxella marmotae TaxID=3344520 RepID=UPI0035D4B966